jgi:hypothetical protein
MHQSLSGPGREVTVIATGSGEACGSGPARGAGRRVRNRLLINNAGAAAFSPVLENGPAAERTTAEVNAVAVATSVWLDEAIRAGETRT